MRAFDMSAIRRPTFEQFRAFVAVADTGGFAGAAERLGRTQSALTHQIQSLESCLGARLVRRSRGHFGGLTEAGAALLPRARGVLGALDGAVESVGHAALAGRVRIGVNDDFAPERLIALVARIRDRHPGVEISVVADLSARLEGRLAAGEIDLALVRRDEEPVANDALAAEALSWAVAPGARPGGGGSVPLVLFHEGCAYRRRAIGRLEAAGLDWRIAYAGASYAAMRAAAAAGFGVTVLPTAEVARAADLIPAADAGFALPDPGRVGIALLGGGRRDRAIEAVRREITRGLGGAAA